MAKERAPLFEDDELDISEFSPKANIDQSAPAQEKVKAGAEAARFTSREPPSQPVAVPKRAPRLHRTGRNVQFNMKATQETITAFYAVCDRTGWVLGETLERAIAALERELNAKIGQGTDD